MKRLAGECMTEDERLAILRRVEAILEAYEAGRMTLAQAQHEAQAALAPIKRRVRRLVLRTHGERMGAGRC